MGGCEVSVERRREKKEGKGRCASMCVCFLCGYIETGRASRGEREGGEARWAVGVGMRMQERRALSRVWAVAGRQHRQCEGDEEAVRGRDEWEGCGGFAAAAEMVLCVCLALHVRYAGLRDWDVADRK